MPINTDSTYINLKVTWCTNEEIKQEDGKVQLTLNQARFLREAFGTEATWPQIIETLLRVRMNEMMIAHLRATKGEEFAAIATPPRAPNPLMIPEDQLPPDCPAAVKLKAKAEASDEEYGHGSGS